jgi:ArpU family phage transcriptional regulator
VELFPEVDVNATCDNVNHFFRKDLEKTVLLAGCRMVDLQSPQLSDMPSGTHDTSRIENGLIDATEAQEIVMVTSHALNRGIDPISRSILISLFIKHERWIDAQHILYKEHTSFNRLRRRALLSFAFAFEGWQRKLKSGTNLELIQYEM